MRAPCDAAGTAAEDEEEASKWRPAGGRATRRSSPEVVDEAPDEAEVIDEPRR